jgi:hypothetical protein
VLFRGKASELTRADRTSQELSLVDRVGLASSFGALIRGWTPTCSTSSCRGAVGLPARLGAAGYLGELFFHCQVARTPSMKTATRAPVSRQMSLVAKAKVASGWRLNGLRVASLHA